MTNCCDDYGQCRQGHGCPARETKVAPTHQDDNPCGTSWVVDLLWGFFAALGLIAVAAFFGLYAGGFFHWTARALPDNAVLNLLFGA